MTDTPLLTVDDAVKTYTIRRRDFHRVRMTAVDHASLVVNRGETVGLVGESGSGKSTLGRCILNLTQLDSGQINFRGQPIQSLSESDYRPLRRHLQMVFQNPMTSFNPTMTIAQTLLDAMRLVPEMSGNERKNRVLKLLDQVELSPRFANLYPYEMSGGQLQRIAVARALAPGPDFIFLDEPTAALDMSIKGQIVNLLVSLQRQTGVSFIFVSHDLRVVRYVAQRIYVMYLGQIVESGPAEDVFEHPQHPYTRALLSATQLGRGPRPAQKAALRGELMDTTATGCKLYGRCPFGVERCREPQVLRDTRPAHAVRCWRAEEIDRELRNETLRTES